MIDESKFFEAAQALAQSLSQWALLIIGGSLVTIVSTSYYRPESRRVRSAYLLFLPTWFLLAFSIYEGIRVQRAYVGYLVAARLHSAQTIENIAKTMEDATRQQIQWLQLALLFLGAWLLIYIAWWIFSAQTTEKSKE